MNYFGLFRVNYPGVSGYNQNDEALYLYQNPFCVVSAERLNWRALLVCKFTKQQTQTKIKTNYELLNTSNS